MLISRFLDDDVIVRIAGMEKKYEIKLPYQYKKFLYKYNGGYTPRTKFETRKVSSDIRGFYGVGNVKMSIDGIEVGKWVKRSLFPIASDSFGNYIVIGISGVNEGNIFFCGHEEENKVEYVASDLKRFFEICTSKEISEASKRTIKEREADLIAKGRGNIITDDLRKMWQAEIDKYGGMVQEEVLID